jgi:hypothetical protein
MESAWPELAPAQEPQNWNELAADAESQAALGDLADTTGHFASQVDHLEKRAGLEWSATQERALAELIGWSIIRSTSIESAGIEELLRGIRRAGISLPGDLSSVFLAAPGQAELSSAGLSNSPPLANEFWFNVNAELVIYGATQPDAVVSIGGRPISLRPDGTFSYRFSLPNGRYELPLVARSSKGEERSATLGFSRGTTYSEGTGSHPQAPELKAPLVENIR